jgi:hypothetical protein
MASIAIDVLPVFESPIINSLWPWPIGTKLSTTLIPVSKGTLTEDLAIIEGALVSILFRDSHKISPASSKGSPRDLQLYPIKHHLQVCSSVHWSKLQIVLVL